MITEKYKRMVKSIVSRRMLVALIMGFASGLPLLLTKGVLQAWMKKEGIDLSLIGLTNLLALPYAVKFLWAPFLDRYTIALLGRRRGWLLAAQIALVCAIAGMGFYRPVWRGILYNSGLLPLQDS